MDARCDKLTQSSVASLSLSVHLYVQLDERNAARRAGLSAVAELLRVRNK